MIYAPRPFPQAPRVDGNPDVDERSDNSDGQAENHNNQDEGQGVPIMGLLPYRRTEPVPLRAQQAPEGNGILMKSFLVPNQFMIYRTNWEYSGMSRSFFRVGLPYCQTESDELAMERRCNVLADFDSGLLQRFDAVTSRFKLQNNWNAQEMEEVRNVLEQMLESFNPGSCHFRHDILEVNSYVARALQYSDVIGFSALSGKTSLKIIEGGVALQRAGKPENLQSMVHRICRFDLLFPTQRKRALARMFLGKTRSELPASCSLISPSDFHNMTSKAIVLPKEQKDVFLIASFCEGQCIGSLLFAGKEQEMILTTF